MTLSRRALGARVRHWIKVLRLQDWTITISRAVPASGDTATCEPLSEYKRATLEFDPTIPDEEMDSFIVHELLHCHVHKLANCAVALAGEDKAKQEWARHEEEHLVTTLERLVLALTMAP